MLKYDKWYIWYLRECWCCIADVSEICALGRVHFKCAPSDFGLIPFVNFSSFKGSRIKTQNHLLWGIQEHHVDNLDIWMLTWYSYKKILKTFVIGFTRSKVESDKRCKNQLICKTSGWKRAFIQNPRGERFWDRSTWSEKSLHIAAKKHIIV